MFKKIHPTKNSHLEQFPHCDARILHAPSECKFCDAHPDWQSLRMSWGIAFTGYEPEDKELPDPATFARGDGINRWHGNVAQPTVSVTSGQDLIPEARTFPIAGVKAAMEKIIKENCGRFIGPRPFKEEKD